MTVTIWNPEAVIEGPFRHLACDGESQIPRLHAGLGRPAPVDPTGGRVFCARAGDAHPAGGQTDRRQNRGTAFRSGYPEVSARNKSFSAIRQKRRLVAGDAQTDIHPDLGPGPGDVVVTKRRVSAFSGSDLDIVLRAADIDTLVLAGVATSGVVLSTVRLAADLDYRITVLQDGCADSDPEVHRVLTEKVFPRQAMVRTISDWIGAIKG